MDVHGDRRCSGIGLDHRFALQFRSSIATVWNFWNSVVVFVEPGSRDLGYQVIFCNSKKERKQKQSMKLLTKLGLPDGGRGVYFLPSLHLSLCLVSMLGLLIPELQVLGIIWSFIMLADLPISIVAYAMGWKYSWIGVIWIIGAGTLWWYALSCGLKFVYGRYRDLRAPL